MRIGWKSNLHGVARCPADFKILGEGEPAGTFEAYVAIFGTPDRPDLFGDSDIIEPGAFTQTLREKGLPPVVWSHVWTIPPVGQALQAVEDAKGLRIKARLFLDDEGISGQYARSIHTGMTATPPVVREFSFAFEAKEWSDEKAQNGQYIRHLKRLELFEVGPVLVGRHPDTELIAAKGQRLEREPAAIDPQIAARSLAAKSPAFLRARWDAALKAGARNAAEDLKRLNDIHDLAGEIQSSADTSHTHSVTIPAHSHALVFGIYEGTGPTPAANIRVTVNGTDRTAALGGPFTADFLGKDVTQYLQDAQGHPLRQRNTIVFTAAELLDLEIVCKSLVTATSLVPV